MTDVKFTEGIILIETATGMSFTPDRLKVYKILLNDIPDDLFVLGVNNMLRERVFSNIPMPAEIRQYCLGLKDDDLTVKITLATNNIKKALSEIGTYNDVIFDDPVIHLCIINSIGGWIALGMKPLKEFDDWLKWDFPKLYKSFSSRKNQDIPLVLEGKAGKEFKTLNYVGDKNRCLKWTEKYIEVSNKPINKLLSSVNLKA